jgi:hypothetical protein
MTASHKALFEADTMLHPHVQEAYDQAVRVLKRKAISFRVTGGIALNLYNAGRPTKYVDLIVSRKDWHRARESLQSVATDIQGHRFGLPEEPANGLAVIGPQGVPIEVWPEGTTHEQIARVRGKHRPHPAGRLALTLAGDDVTALLNNKLASYLSATDRLRDASDVQSLIARLKLPVTFATKLAPSVRSTYRRIWKGEI